VEAGEEAMSQKKTEKGAAIELMEVIKGIVDYQLMLNDWGNRNSLRQRMISVKVQHIKAGVVNRNGKVFEYAVIERFVQQINRSGGFMTLDTPMMVTKDVTSFVDISYSPQAIVGYIDAADIVDGEIICKIIIPDPDIRALFQTASEMDTEYTLSLWYGDAKFHTDYNLDLHQTITRITFANCTGLTLYKDPRKKPTAAVE
jgi:hypothetical protein